MRREGGGLLLVLAVILGITFYGPALAKQFSNSALQIIGTLAPIVGPVLAIGLVLLLFRQYWNRW